MKSGKRIAVQIGLLAAGAAMILLGIFGGDLVVIFRKAVYICLECIGIG